MTTAPQRLVRLYGTFRRPGSLSTISVGFRRALEQAGLLAGVVEVEDEDAVDDGTPSAPGAEAPVAIFCGPYDMVGQLRRRGRHAVRLGLLHANTVEGWSVGASDDLSAGVAAVPRGLLRAYGSACTHVLAAEPVWSQPTLTRAFVGERRRVLTAPHGVLPPREGYVPMEERDRVVLHASSSGWGRKGTVELLRAWPASRPRKWGYRLVAVVDRSEQTRLLQAVGFGADELRSRGIDLIDRNDGLVSDESARWWERLAPSTGTLTEALSRVSLVVQPSRGEAFGFVPVEARVRGTPVLQTLVGGHQDHPWRFHGVIPPQPPRFDWIDGWHAVKAGAYKRIEDVPGVRCVAPEVSVHRLMTALSAFEPCSDEVAERFAGAARERFDWTQRLRSLLEQIRSGEIETDEEAAQDATEQAQRERKRSFFADDAGADGDGE